MPSSTPNRSVADELLAQGAISKDDHRRAVDVAEADGEAVAEVLIELGLVSERELLRHLATQHGVLYADSEKVKTTKLARAALDKVPAELARRLDLCPVRFDAPSGRLVVLSADPNAQHVLEELKRSVEVDQVQVVVARPAAVQAALAAGYDGDSSALEALGPPKPGAKKADFSSTMRSADGVDGLLAGIIGAEVGVDETSATDTDDSGAFSSPDAPVAASGRQDRDASPAASDAGGAADAEPSRRPSSGPPGDVGAGSPLPRRRSSRPAGAARRASGQDLTGFPSVAATMGQSISIGSLPPPPARLSIGPVARAEATGPVGTDDALLRASRVFVGLLESDRGELRGHSAFVARLTQDACQRAGLSEQDTSANVIAAYLHDLGKAGSPSSPGRARRAPSTATHLTPLNVAKFKVYRQLARELIDVPVLLMESVGLAQATRDALQTMYERVDGKGLPRGMAGQDIPLGGRILAVADTYADLTRNSHNTFDRLLEPEKAMGVLSEQVGKLFDKNVVEVFGRAMAGERIAQELLDEQHRALVVDPDVEQTLVLQLRLADEGLDVHVVRSAREARAALKARSYALVVTEVDLGSKEQGIELCESLAKTDRCRSATWVFLARRQTKTLVRRAFRAGAADFVAKPVSADILVAKLIELAERSKPEADPSPPTSRGVAGALADMALTDVVQILWHGQRTGALHLELADRRGEIHFKNGQIVHAVLEDAVGETALYRLLDLGSKDDEEGQFRVDPSFVPSAEPSISASPEALMLEAMRLIDEGTVP